MVRAAIRPAARFVDIAFCRPMFIGRVAAGGTTASPVAPRPRPPSGEWIMPNPARFSLSARAVPLLLAMAAGGTVGADVVVPPSVPRAGTLALRTGTINVSAFENRLAGADAAAPLGPGKLVVTLDGPLDPARRAALVGAGVRLGGYLPMHSFIADAPAATAAALNALGFVESVVAYQDAWKLAPELRAGPAGRIFITPGRQALAATGEVIALVWLFEGEDSAPTVAALAALPGAAVTSNELVGRTVCLGVRLRGADVPALASIPAVQFAEHAPEYTERSNYLSRWVIQSNQIGVLPLGAQGLTGAGQVMGIIDGRLNADHCSFRDAVNPIGPAHRKILAFNAAPGNYSQHGTHVAGTAVGNDQTLDTSVKRGVAHDAKLVYNIYPLQTETSHLERYSLHHTQGARVQTNSWGDDSTTAYDGGCRAIDEFQRDTDDCLIVFSVSNNSTVRNPENAKNALAVAATGGGGNQDAHCSGGTGPTADGRRKPDVMAPGCGVVSSSGSGLAACTSVPLTGTSMAAPAAAGIALLTRQYFTSGFYPSGAAAPADAFVPTGQLLKAMLVNASVDITGVAGYPSNREGWGRVLADNALYFAGDDRKLLVAQRGNAAPDALETGDAASLIFISQGGLQQLRITLAYADAGATAGTTFAPVNDLNLVATSPSGVVYLGNVFASGQSATGGAADALNNLEQVHTDAEPGAWTVTVNGTAVNDGPQGFALVITGPVGPDAPCGSTDFDGDGDAATDADIEAFFTVIGGLPCPTPSCGSTDFDLDGDEGTDADIEAFFRVIGGGPCAAP